MKKFLAFVMAASMALSPGCLRRFFRQHRHEHHDGGYL